MPQVNFSSKRIHNLKTDDRNEIERRSRTQPCFGRGRRTFCCSAHSTDAITRASLLFRLFFLLASTSVLAIKEVFLRLSFFLGEKYLENPIVQSDATGILCLTHSQLIYERKVIIDMKSAKTGKLTSLLQRDNVVGYVFSAPFIIGFLGFTLIPILVSFYYSLTDYNMVNAESWVGLKNYVRLFTDERFQKSVLVTLQYVFLSVPLKLAFALFVAYLLTRKSRAVTFYRSLYYVPSLIGGSIAVALVWKEIFSRKGLINVLLGTLGFDSVNWFGNQNAAMIPLILMSVWQFGSSMIIFAAGLKEIPRSYYEAAQIDGANKRQMFGRITLPCLSPIILYNLIMQTIAAFMSFTQAFVITKGGPNDATMLYALYVYNQGFKYYDMGYASAMSWFMLVVMSLITFAIFKSSQFWVHSESGND